MQGTIELDCAPFRPRPGDLLPAVIAGTPLEGKLNPEAPDSMAFGNWTWRYDLDDEEAEETRDVLRTRITTLYNSGAIRYGSW